VIGLEYPWGEIADPERVIRTCREHKMPRSWPLVSCGNLDRGAPAAGEIGPGNLPRGHALFLVDCVTSLGGIPVEVDHWKIDLAYSCSQKCIGMPRAQSSNSQ